MDLPILASSGKTVGTNALNHQDLWGRWRQLQNTGTGDLGRRNTKRLHLEVIMKDGERDS